MGHLRSVVGRHVPLALKEETHKSTRRFPHPAVVSNSARRIKSHI